MDTLNKLKELLSENYFHLEFKYQSEDSWKSSAFIRFRIKASHRPNSGKLEPKPNSDELYKCLQEFSKVLEIDPKEYRVLLSRYVWYGTDGYARYHTLIIKNIHSDRDRNHSLDKIYKKIVNIYDLYKKIRIAVINSKRDFIDRVSEIVNLEETLKMLPENEEVKNLLEDKKQTKERDFQKKLEKEIEKLNLT